MSGTVLRGGGSETTTTEVARLRRSSGGMKLRGATVERLRAGGESETTTVVEFILRKDAGGSFLRGTAGGRLRADEETISGPGSQLITPYSVGLDEDLAPWGTSGWGTSPWGSIDSMGSVVVTVGAAVVVPDGIATGEAFGSTSITLNVVPLGFDPEHPDGVSFEAQVGSPSLTNSTTVIFVQPDEIFAGIPSNTEPVDPDIDVLAEGVGEVVVTISVVEDIPVPPNAGGLRDIPNQRFSPRRVRVARSFPRRVRT